MLGRIFVLALLALVSADADCTRGCEDFCKTVRCLDPCLSACRQTHLPDEPYHRLDAVASLGSDFPITGSDSPWPYGPAVYFTTLGGRVYSLNVETREVKVVLDMKSVLIYRENGCGLYDIAFHPDFLENRRVFLYMAMKPMKSGQHHVNGILEYRMWRNEMSYVGHVATFAHDAPTSHGWMKSTIKKYITGGPSSLLVTNHGDSTAYQSAITQVEVSYDPNPQLWASGIGAAISCDRSIYADQRVSCVHRKQNSAQLLYTEFQHNRLYGNCQGERGCRTALIEFPGDDCPVESIKLLSNTKFNRMRAAPYFHQAACVRNGQLQPSRILRRYMDHKNNQYKVVEMPTATADGLVPTLYNTSFVGADRYPHLFLGGYSIRDNAYFIYEVVPLRVLE